MAKGKYEKWLELDGLLLLTAWARDGLTDAQIATNMGIAYSTLREWKDKFSALSAALKKGKEVTDIEVENSLFKRAMGYSYDEVTQELVTDVDEYGDVIKALKVTKVVRKEAQPDTTAQIFWLKNRKPEQWRDKSNVELTGKDGGPVEIESPRERIERRVSSAASRIGEKANTE